MKSVPYAKEMMKMKTIKIEVCDGIVSEVKGLPEGYQYEIVECDKYGKPLDNRDEINSCEECNLPNPEPYHCGDCSVPEKGTA